MLTNLCIDIDIMKVFGDDFVVTRGRQPKRAFIKAAVVGILKRTGIGSIYFLAEKIGPMRGKTVSWNTLKKYLDELIAEKKIDVMESDFSDGKKSRGARRIYFIGHSFGEAARAHAAFKKQEAELGRPHPTPGPKGF